MASQNIKVIVPGVGGGSHINFLPEMTPSESFDPEKVKKEYDHLTFHQIQNEIKGTPPFFSTESLNMFIEKLQNKEVESEDYHLREENGEIILVKRAYIDSEPLSTGMKVLSAEQCYDIMLETHMATNHGDLQTMTDRMKYSVPALSIKTIILACNVCAEKRVLDMEKRNNNIWTICIKNVSKFNNEFPFLLFYVETNSNYILIRPLKTNKFEDIALELFKIFMTFGPPVTLYISGKHLKTMTKVQSRIKNVHPDCAFRLHVCKVKTGPLKQQFASVMKRNNISYTAIGYHKAQYIMNKLTPQAPRDTFFASQAGGT